MPVGQIWKYYYYAGSQPVAIRVTGSQNPQENGLFYTLGDQLGSTSVITDSNGNKVSEARYTPWGETRFSSGSAPTDRKYTGQREDAGIGLYYYNARWYDAKLGRFTQADTVIGKGVDGYDRYAYVKNSPIQNSDPSGHEGCSDIPDGGARENCYATGSKGLTQPWTGNLKGKSLDWMRIYFILLGAGVSVEGTMSEWTLDRMEALLKAVNDIGYRLVNNPAEIFH
jgi:RHS repeat-associated protein